MKRWPVVVALALTVGVVWLIADTRRQFREAFTDRYHEHEEC